MDCLLPAPSRPRDWSAERVKKSKFLPSRIMECTKSASSCVIERRLRLISQSYLLENSLLKEISSPSISTSTGPIFPNRCSLLGFSKLCRPVCGKAVRNAWIGNRIGTGHPPDRKLNGSSVFLAPSSTGVRSFPASELRASGASKTRARTGQESSGQPRAAQGSSEQLRTAQKSRGQQRTAQRSQAKVRTTRNPLSSFGSDS